MMASYFEEHDLGGEDPGTVDEDSATSRFLLDLARRLLESGFFLEERRNTHFRRTTCNT